LPPPAGQPTLFLAELEQLGLQNNPSLARAAALVGAARGNWLQVGLPPNPTVGYEGQQLGSGGEAEQHGVLVGQEFVRGGKLRLNRAVAEQEVLRAEHELAVQQQRVLTDVRIAFYQVLLAQRQIDVTAELVRISQQGLETAEAIFRATEGSRIDVLQAQLERENAQILAENARNRHQAAWQSLTAVVGAPGLPCQPLAGDAYAPPCEYNLHDTLARIQSTSPEIGVALANIERARWMLERARAEPRPNVNVQGLVNWIDNGIDGKPDAGLSVTVPLPLWNANQGAVLKAQQELAAAQQALGQLELELQQRLAPAFERYANARNQVQRYRTRILPAAQQSLELTRKIYAAGEINYVSLLTVQRTFSQTNLSYLEALRELRTAEAEIEGLLLSQSLQAR
jgi:cobalt-zinc-cadmium efflux system outer membrane protein